MGLVLIHMALEFIYGIDLLQFEIVLWNIIIQSVQVELYIRHQRLALKVAHLDTTDQMQEQEVPFVLLEIVCKTLIFITTKAPLVGQYQ